MLSKIEISTPPKESLTNITQQVKDFVKTSKVQEGICTLFVPHTTAGIIINSAMEENTSADIISEIHRLIPTRVDFLHIYDTPADAAGHIKSSIIGTNQTLIITQGNLLLGSSQSILFFEFDGPRDRQILVKIIADKE